MFFWPIKSHCKFRINGMGKYFLQLQGLGKEERGMRQSCPLRLEKLSNNKISIRKPVTKTNVLSACPEPGTLAYIIL